MTSAGGYLGRKVVHSGGLWVKVSPLLGLFEACGGFVYAGPRRWGLFQLYRVGWGNYAKVGGA